MPFDRSDVDRLDACQPLEGYWLGWVGCLTRWWNDHMSFTTFARYLVRSAEGKRAGIEKQWIDKHRSWVEEFATLVAIGASFLALRYAYRPASPTPSAGLIAGWIVYRTLDMTFFNMSWVFIDTGELFSARRSLVGTFLNIVELAILSAAASNILGGGAIHERGRLVLDNLLRLITLEKPVSDGWQFVVDVTFTVIGTFLLLVVVAGLAGRTVRRSKRD